MSQRVKMFYCQLTHWRKEVGKEKMRYLLTLLLGAKEKNWHKSARWVRPKLCRKSTLSGRRYLRNVKFNLDIYVYAFTEAQLVRALSKIVL